MFGAVRDRLKARTPLPPLFGFASGIRAGAPASVGACLDGEIPGGMGPMTCIPTAVALEMLACGEVERRGVLAPEACIDPARFFARLEPFVKRDKGSGPLVRVAES
jgi:hypothetical protein